MGTTSNYSWPYPESSDYVADGATAMENLADAADASVFSIGQGIVAQSGTTSSVTWIGTNAATLVSTTATITAGRLYLVYGKTNIQFGTAAGGNALYVAGVSVPTETIWYQTTAIGTNLNKSMSGWTIYTSTALSVTTGTASRTFDLNIYSGANGGTNFNPDGLIGANTFPTRIVVLDIGEE